jgi:hypothetical protein
LFTRLRGFVITPMPGTAGDSSTHIDKRRGDDSCLTGMRALLDGIVDADPIVVGLVVLALVVIAVLHVARRLGGGGRAR